MRNHAYRLRIIMNRLPHYVFSIILAIAFRRIESVAYSRRPLSVCICLNLKHSFIFIHAVFGKIYCALLMPDGAAGTVIL